MSLIIFDMDGVIVNVSGSYREAARRATGVFLGFLANAQTLPNPLFTLNDLAYVKQSGGLNNDWDVTYKLIDLLAGVFDPELKPQTLSDLAQINAAPLAAYLKTGERPLQRLYNQNPGYNHVFKAFYTGDVGSGNVIKQIFQEIYLGQKLFKETYGLPAQFVFEDGLIGSETLFLQPAFLHRLAQKHTLALATGRPRGEAEYPLQKHNLTQSFAMLLSHDDCVAAALAQGLPPGGCGKPSPYMPDTITQAFKPANGKYYFVGDMPDDMLAAKNARQNFTAVGVTYSAADKETARANLLKAGANVVFDDTAALENFLFETA